MGIVEIILIVAGACACLTYLIYRIYALKHPERIKQKKKKVEDDDE